MGRRPDLSRCRRFAGAALAGLSALAACDEPASRPAGEVPAVPVATTAAAADPTLSALADSLLPALERLSRLTAVRPLILERQSVQEVRAFVEAQLEEEMPQRELDGVRATYGLLGLIPDTLDLRGLLRDLYVEQIVGYYDPEVKKLFVVEGVAAHAVRPVVAHELVHALQDQHTNIDSLIARERGNDRQTAAQAALEGHATIVMFALLAEEASRQVLDPVTLPNLADQLRPPLESPSGDFPVFRRAPRIVRETLLFPYISGARFVQELWRTQPADRRTAPLGPLLPQSTEQVLDPGNRFFTARDHPTEIRFDPDSTWPVLYENGLGRLETGILLEEHLGAGANGGAEGWDGDRFRLLRAPDGAHALLWYSVWDDDAAADRFAAGMGRVLAGPLTRTGTVERLEVDGRPAVRITIGARTLSAPIPTGTIHLSRGDAEGAEG